ncbi:AraC family transcriptional regulator [Marinobacterium rhizophilum]|uniref:AraC family transcriptional regulator n=1 Tax=Marinobacterium rhizophilum TaxID=420402 RepID=UPI002102F250|nr:AraC family transcriptional regulator [Marinobacterium rhizophilum]
MMRQRGTSISIFFSTRSIVDQARDSIDAHLGESISLADLACCVGVTARTLQNGFQRFLDCTPTEYIREFP